MRRNERIALRIVGVADARVILSEWRATERVLPAIGVVAGAPIRVTGARSQLVFIILVSAYRDKDNHIVFVKFCKMAHVNVTVSLVVDVAVTV